MIEVKDKIVTVESLSTVHEHNKKTYMTQNNPSGNGTFTMDGNANFTGSISIGNTILSYDTAENALKISFITNENEVEETVEESTE